MSNIFAQMAKSLIESANGMIRVYPNGYKFDDRGTTNAQGVYLKPTVSADGRMKSIAIGVRSAANCPKPPGDYPQSERGGAWVPMKVCRKCLHHLPRKRRHPYPCCAALREIRRKGPSPAEQFTTMLKTATDKAKEILG